MQKVLIFNLTPRMGMLHYSAQFSNELVKQGYKVKIAIASYYKGDNYDAPIEFLKLTTNPTLFSFIKDSLNIIQHYKFIGEIKKYKPNIIHFMDNHPWYIFYGRFLKKLGYTIYITQHDPLLHSGENKTFLGKIGTLTNNVLRDIADKLIVHGDVLKQQVIDIFRYPSDKIVSVPHGNYNFFSKWAQNLGIRRNSFLFFGRIVAYKGLDIVLESLFFVKKEIQDFTLVIAGNGTLEPYQKLLYEYKELIELHHEDIPDHEVYKYVESAEFVVLPYKDATGSGVIPLAYAFSKAVIASDVGELGSHVFDGKTGILLQKNTPQELAKAIIWMLKHKKEASIMGENGRKYTEEILGWDKIVKTIYFP